jgi:hypothetical protein
VESDVTAILILRRGKVMMELNGRFDWTMFFQVQIDASRTFDLEYTMTISYCNRVIVLRMLLMFNYIPRCGISTLAV